MELNKIFQGHSLDVLKAFPANSIDMCITSPPYWGLRDYETEPVKWNDGWQGELGTETNCKDYINHLCDIFDEVKRVLKKNGTCWVNISDTYKDKSLCLIPYRFTIEMKERGWIVRNVIIWQKPNVTPTSAKDRFTNDFEYLLFFSKSKNYYFKQQFEPFKESTIERAERKFTENKSQFYNGLSLKNQLNFHNKIKNNELKGRNKRTIWSISPARFKGAHFATFPTSLVQLPMIAASPINGIIIDPFIGSGTTAVVAEKNKRNWLGIEINPSYIELAKARISNHK